MNAHARPQPVGGSIFTAPFLLLVALAALAGGLIVWRFAAGLGQTTALNDGYPWGLWIAFDVVTGSALACGGYALMLLVYVMNRGKYHPLVRPALVTSALGYSIAGLSVVIDIGRPWLAWKLPLPLYWNIRSPLLEVALCIMTYTLVLWIELSPSFLERASGSGVSWVRRSGQRLLPLLRKSLVWIAAFGLLLPTMHQSGLGTLLVLSGPRLHPLWSTIMLPLLFLASCIAMGFGVVVLESALSARFLGRKPETEMLAGLGFAMLPVVGAYLVLRFADLVVRGQVGALFAFDVYSLMCLLEFALLVGGVSMLREEGRRRDLGNLFRAAMVLLLGATLYRFDVFLLAFQPGPHWSYFPNLTEILVTTGLVAGEVAGYILIVKLFPILGGQPRPAPAR